MKGCNSWSYAPYTPLLRDTGDIYICRIAPGKNHILFQWLENGAMEYTVFCRKRNEKDFVPVGKTTKGEYTISDLDTDTDYEIYVEADGKKSLVRLARTGHVEGSVVNYLHPEDDAYAFSGKYLCSPSLLRHPDGFLLASMDLYASKYPQNLTLIFRSDDNGRTWHYVSELMPCFWGKMFIHKNELYMLACSTEYGDLLIGKSTDGGKTFGTPVCLLRGSTGKNDTAGTHRNPQNLVIHNGRIYTALEWGSYQAEYSHAAMVMSCPVDADLMDPESWTFTEPTKFEIFTPELAYLPKGTVPIEGTMALSPDGELFNIIRPASFYLPMSFSDEDIAGDENLKKLSELILKGCAIAYRVDEKDPHAPITFSHTVPLATTSKFTVKHDPVSGKYYTLASRITDKTKLRARTVLSLFSSEDLREFKHEADILDYSDQDSRFIGFQYADFEIEGSDMIFLSRTAMNNANNYHDANYQTFHRIENFRDL